MARRASSRDMRPDARSDRPSSLHRRRPASAGYERLSTGTQDIVAAPVNEDHGKRLQLVSGLHAQKVAALLNSQNKLQCENARLKREDLEHRDARRGPALARAEAELSKQDAMIHALSDHLGKDIARPLIRETLQAGPRRICPKSRIELKWEVEDVQRELQVARLENEISRSGGPMPADAGSFARERAATDGSRHVDGATVDDATLALLSGGSPDASGSTNARLAAVKRGIEADKKRAIELSQENQGLKVETTSLDRVLKQGAEQIMRLQEAPTPAPGSIIWGPTATSDRLTLMQQELLDENRTKTDLEQAILKSDQEVQDRQYLHDRRVRELAQLREALAKSRREASVVFQQQLLDEKKKTSVQQGYVEQAQGKLKELRGHQQMGLLDGKRRIAALSNNMPHREEATKRDAMQEAESAEEASALAFKELFEDIARLEKNISVDTNMALADCKASREEEVTLRRELQEAQAALRKVSQEHKAAEERHLENLEQNNLLEAQLAAGKDAWIEQKYWREELQDAKLRVENERHQHDAKKKDITSATKRQKQRLARQYPSSPRPGRTVAEIEAAIVATRSSAASEMARSRWHALMKMVRARKEVEEQREKLKSNQEPIRLFKAAAADRAAAQAELERVTLLLAAQREREAAARDLARARALSQQLLAEQDSTRQREAAAELEQLRLQQAAEGRDAAVVRAQIERLNGDAQSLPDVADELSMHSQNELDFDMADSTASMISLGDSLVSDVRHHLQDHINLDKLVKAEQEAAQEARLASDPSDEAQELEELFVRSAELEDLCLDLEGQRSFLERQVQAAKALIRRKVAGTQLPRAGCPLCEHCQAFSIS